MPDTRFFLVAYERNGFRWTGRCERIGDRLQVCSAWGFAESRIGRRKPRNLARELMVSILAAKLAELDAAE